MSGREVAQALRDGGRYEVIELVLEDREATADEIAERLPSGARLSLPCRSDPPDESGGSYESECRPGGPYGALEIVHGGGPWAPAVAGERDPTAGVELHALCFEKAALCEVAARLPARADLTARIDDPMPWHITFIRKRAHRVSDLAGMAAQAGKPRDLAVGSHPSGRNAPDHRVDTRVRTC